MFAKLGQFSYDRRRWVLSGALLFFALSLFISRDLVDELQQGGFADPSSESARTGDLLAELELGVSSLDLVLLFDAGGESMTTIDGYRAQRDVIAVAKRSGALASTPLSYINTGERTLLSKDKTKAIAVLSLKGTDTEKRDRYRTELADQLRLDGITVLHGGEVPAGIELNELIRSSVGRGELISLPLSLGLLIFVFAGLVAAGLPIAAAVIAVSGALAAIRVLAEVADLSVLVVAVVTMLGLGVTIDYSLFILKRYQEEMAVNGDDVRESISRAVATAGRAVAFSGITTVLSMGSLLFFNEMIFRSLALGSMVAVGVAFINAVIVLPAMIGVLGASAARAEGSRALWPPHRLMSRAGRLVLRLAGRDFNRFSRAAGTPPEHGLWFRIARLGRRWPGPVAVISLVVLGLAGLPFFSIELSLPNDGRVLPARSEARIVEETIGREFTRGSGPTKIALTFDDGSAVEHYDEIGAYSDALLATAGVFSATAISRNDSLPDEVFHQYRDGTLEAFAIPDVQRAIDFFAHEGTAYIELTLNDAPQTAEAQATLARLREVELPAGSLALFGGPTAQLVDSKASLRTKGPLVIGYVVAVTFVALLLQFGSLVIPAKAIVMNVASITASFGALVFIFQDGHLQGLLRFEEVGFIPTTIPVLIFAIAFGLSIDYEIFLISRIKEEYDATGDTGVAVARGLQRTGRIITGAALVMVAIAAAFATSELVFMKQLGVGLGLAILIDATIVRALLVPSAMQLMGRANWWAPRPLQRLSERLGGEHR